MVTTLSWTSVWAASIQAAWPLGSPVVQPDLGRALSDPGHGLENQSLRMVVTPALWGRQLRVRLCNAFGDRQLHLRGAGIALHLGGGAIEAKTWRPVHFAGQDTVVIAAGASVWSDAVTLDWLDDPSSVLLRGRTLAIDWHIDGASGPLSWHAKAMTTSYLSLPGVLAAGQPGALDFPCSTTSWFLVDALDMMLPADRAAIVAFGDSLTDGTHTTLNSHDRWPDLLQRRLWQAGHTNLAVLNAGIGSNQIAWPRAADGQTGWRGGMAGVERLERDVLSLSGVRTVIWLEGINDFSDNGPRDLGIVLTALREGVQRLRAAGLQVWGCTLPSALHSWRPGHGNVLQDDLRRAYNSAVRTAGLFDHLLDLDAVTLDVVSGGLAAEFDQDSTTGGRGDGIHPGRAGQLRMAQAIDLPALVATTR